MPVDVMWDNETHTRIRYRFYDKWTWDEAWEAMSSANAMSREESHTVHALIDLTDNNWFPPGAITQFRASRKMRPPNRGYFVIITSNTLIRTIENMVRLLFPNAVSDYHTARTYDEALSRLAELTGDETDDQNGQQSAST